MTPTQRLDTLIAAARSLGILVERVPLGGEGGGLAVLAGKRKLFIDTMADPLTAYETTLTAMIAIPELPSLKLPDCVSSDLDRLRET